VSDLTAKEQASVRIALRFLRTRCGTWEALWKALRFSKATMRRTIDGGEVSASMAVRVARLAGVGVDDVLTGRYPLPGTCPHCGHRAETAEAAE